MEKCAQKQEQQDKKVERRLITGQQQQRMVIVGDLMRKIRSKGMDAENRWWVSELLVADCEKVWIHTGRQDILQKWYKWLEEMKKRDDKGKMKELHQHKRRGQRRKIN